MALYPTCRGHCRCPHGRQRGDFDGRQHADASWAIGRRMQRYRERWCCRVPLHRAGSSAGQKINPEQWPAGYGVVESAGSCFQPAGSADCRLDGSPQPLFCGAERFIKLISVRVAENEHVDVTHGPRTSLPFTSDGPRAVDVRRRGPFDVGQGGSEYGRNPEGTGEHLGQSRVVGTGGVGTDQSSVSGLPRCQQACLFSALDLPVHRWMRSARPDMDTLFPPTAGPPSTGAPAASRPTPRLPLKYHGPPWQAASLLVPGQVSRDHDRHCCGG